MQCLCRGSFVVYIALGNISCGDLWVYLNVCLWKHWWWHLWEHWFFCINFSKFNIGWTKWHLLCCIIFISDRMKCRLFCCGRFIVNAIKCTCCGGFNVDGTKCYPTLWCVQHWWKSYILFCCWWFNISEVKCLLYWGGFNKEGMKHCLLCAVGIKCGDLYFRISYLLYYLKKIQNCHIFWKQQMVYSKNIRCYYSETL